MAVDNWDLQARTKRFALDVIGLVEELPRGLVPDTLGRQLLRSATSVGANYRAAKRAKSSALKSGKSGAAANSSNCSRL